LALTTAITIAGNLTYDPELRQTQQGKSVVNITVAVSPRVYDRQTNEWKDGEPVFYKCSAFDNLAEHIAHSLSKGNRVIVYGTMKPNTWTDKTTNLQRTENVIQIDEIGPSLAWTNVQIVQGAPRGQSADNTDAGQWAANPDETPW
jgi:single-strand DNA-binding protein